MNFLKRNLFAITLSIIVGLVTVAPYALSMFILGAEYQGMPLFISDDEYTYTARMHEVLDGHWLVGSPFFYEYKSLSPTVPATGEYFYAIPAFLAKLSLVNVILLSRFIFPSVLFLLAFCLFKQLAGEPRETFSANISAAAAGMAVTMLYDQICLKIIFFSPSIFFSSMWTRPVNPILGALAVFVFLIFFWKAINTETRSYKILAGLVMGLSCFYFFSWGLISSILFIATIALLAQKRWADFKKVLYIFSVGALASLPSLMLIFSSLGQRGEGYQERNGMFFTHLPTLNITLLITAGILILLAAYSFYRKRSLWSERWWDFAVWVILGSIWALSQQALTGRALWPYHFVQYTKILAIFFLLLAFYKILRPSFPRLWNAAMITVCFLALASGVAMAGTYKNGLEEFRAAQKSAPVISWLNSNAPKDCVVLAKESKQILAWQVPALTKCNIYDSNWSFSGVPLDRLVHDYFVGMRLKGVTPQSVADYMRENPGELRSVYFENWDQLFAKKIDTWLESRLEASAKEYADFFQKDFASEIRRYRLDYLILDRQLGQKEQDLLGLRTEPIRAGAFYIYPFN